MTSLSGTPFAPRRIAPLAKLPVFFDLQDKLCIVVGGSAAAAWKAELLAAAGARVKVIAETFSPELEQLAEAPRPAGTIALVRRVYSAEDFDGAAMAVADLETEREIALFTGLARAAGVPTNVIDAPGRCDFQFGSIVNRSPVVVGISTNGAAPVLAQAIRARIEVLLPAALADWARAAKRVRRSIGNCFPNPRRRRAFWEALAARALSGDPVSPAAVRPDLGRPPPGGGNGSVTFVGAGPGNPELLTVRAIRALQAADVILFDALVTDEILDCARREAKRLLIGKRGYRRSCRQDDINETMVKLARRGKHVVRLKGGDPSIFARLGEEIAYLKTHGIPFEIIPGITAASAAAARLGVSLTHRDCARSVRITTGHGRAGGLPEDLDWAGIADPKTTNMFYMAGRTGKSLAERLLQNGLPAATPVAVVCAVTRPQEEVIHMELGDLLEWNGHSLSEPTLVCVGGTFSLAVGRAAAGRDHARISTQLVAQL